MAKSAVKPAKRLEIYRKKRDFSKTPEPSGATAAPPSEGGRRFVVQRHRARRLHYDLRLEIDGVLVSWAVPKGPTLDPSARVLAVHVEDHPLDYFDFEGVIPKREYGGGDVIVWDWGTWEPARTDDPREAIENGDLHFDLHGQKLNGRFVLVRTKTNQWLLLHKRDELAQEGWNPEDHPRSVKSGRTNDEVAAEPDAQWTREGEKVLKLSWDPPTEDELTALEALGSTGTWVFQGRELKLTNLDKVLFPPRDDDRPITKRELIRYHALIAPTMLPYLVDRPVNMHRYPNGVDTRGFWHKELPNHAPDWITRWHNDAADPDETQWYAVIDNPPALAWMANYGAVELHPWTSSIPDVHKPTWAFIDIDPGPKNTFDDVITLALLYRTALDHLGVEGLPKVTGQRGIQVWVPIEPDYSFDQTREWVGELSKAIGKTVPDLVSWAWEKKDRKGLARLDYTQNAINKTLVAPYSARAAAGAPVSVPIEWDELGDPDLAPDRWTVRTAVDRLAEVGDPLARLIGTPQRLPQL